MVAALQPLHLLEIQLKLSVELKLQQRGTNSSTLKSAFFPGAASVFIQLTFVSQKPFKKKKDRLPEEEVDS